MRADISHPPKDAAGNIITHPISGWTAGPVQNTAILFAPNYLTKAGTQEATITFILTPAQALELAATLQGHADQILAQRTPPKSHQT